MSGLQKIGNEHFDVTRILRHVDAAAKEFRNSERTMTELVARLIRAQQAEIERLRNEH